MDTVPQQTLTQYFSQPELRFQQEFTSRLGNPPVQILESRLQLCKKGTSELAPNKLNNFLIQKIEDLKALFKCQNIRIKDISYTKEQRILIIGMEADGLEFEVSGLITQDFKAVLIYPSNITFRSNHFQKNNTKES